MSDSDGRRTEPWMPPPSFEEYRLIRQLGAGAMGEVYLAHDTLLDRPVAVKFIAETDLSEARRTRFRLEARAIARLQHTNVVAAYRVGEVQRRPYLVSELVRGRSLREVPKPLPWEQVLRIGIGLARGLAAAHRCGVLHRDIKPANAMLTDDGEVKLLDFGLAKLFDAGTPESRDTPVAPASESASPPPLAPSTELSTTQSLAEHEGGPARAEKDSAPETQSRGAPALRPLPPGDEGEKRVITLHGARVGTPLYMAPEVWRGESGSPRSDVYSLGAVLYDLCTGRAPHTAVSIHELADAVQTRRAEPVATLAPAVEARLAAVIDRCLALAPEERFASGDELREALEQLEEGWRAAGPLVGRPYPGLHAFESADRGVFFGREVAVRAILDRLRGESLVLVAGDSGIGKSSLCRAGVAPRVAEGALGGGRWSVVTLVPGRRPLAALASALGPHLRMEPAILEEELRVEPRALGRRVVMAAQPLLVFVDQLEELLTLAEPREAGAMPEALDAVAGGLPGIRLLGAVRGDFLTRLAALPGLGARVSGALYVVTPLGEAELRDAIVKPARVAGFSFESDSLVESLVQAGRTGGALPLLQFALAELWEAREPARAVIPVAALERLGGVPGALARHADGVLSRLLPEERAAARRMLSRLVTAEGTRARRTEAELLSGTGEAEPARRRVLEALVKGRLIVAQEAEHAGEGWYELAHEALISGWEQLRRWLADDAEERAARQRLESAAREWERLGRPPEGLWNARQLEEVKGLEIRTWSPLEREFERVSRRATRRRRWLRLGAIAALPLTALAVYGGVRGRARLEQNREVARSIATAERAMGVARERGSAAEAVRQRAFDAFDAGREDEGERLWAEALAAEGDAEDGLRAASDALETALFRDAERTDVRRQLAEVLYQRLLAAERGHRKSEQEELAGRLARFDDNGELRARLHAPALLSVVTRPAGAVVQLERYDDDGHWRRLGSARRFGETPIESVSLEPGSYRLRLEVPGRPAVYDPVLLGRGERYAVDVDLPERVPEGFVYVPAGRFLFGSRDDEGIRTNFLPAQPLHEARTVAFLIARHEVTYAEWIEFLRALPPAERERRRPRVENYTLGSMDLSQAPGGKWRLRMVLPSVSNGFAYQASEGERFRYQQRSRRVEQDWLRFPVSGISWNDSLVYLAWLRQTGRVPRARLCEVHEWERAARGADGRLYPSGDRLEPDDANFDQTYGQRPLAYGPDEVGSHPGSDSPFGVSDLSGNLWEWMKWKYAPEEARYGGGSFYQDQLTARSYVHTSDLRSEPTYRTLTNGLRVCADPW